MPIEIIALDTTTQHISSKAARLALKHQTEYLPMLPEVVSAYIRTNALYRPPALTVAQHIQNALDDPYFSRRMVDQRSVLLLPQTNTLLRLSPNRFVDAEKENEDTPSK